jgi:glycerophosphoryl diester phosphodiesterase
MRIICHRGYWKSSAEKNTVEAFQRGFALGLGTETDIRDCDGELVISHDPARSGSLTFKQFLEMTPRSAFLALNVKSDGIANAATKDLEEFGHQNYVFFDMSVPDMQQYLRNGMPTAMRLSEYEPWVESLGLRVKTVWLDAFEGAWYSKFDIEGLLQKGFEVLIVSDELHGRDPHGQWAILDTLAKSDKLTLCTDLPEEALKRFCS